MQVVLALDPPRDLVVDVTAPQARLVDLLHAAGVEAPSDQAWWVDGVRVDVDTPMRDIVLAAGAVVSPVPMRSSPRHAVVGDDCTMPAGAIATVVAGVDSATTHHLPDGRVVEVGRRDPVAVRLTSDTVSGRHLRLVATEAGVEVTDHGSRNGTWVDGHVLVPHTPTTLPLPVDLQLGACILRITPAPACDRPVGAPDRLPDGRWSFNRPPRGAPPAPVPPVAVPVPPPGDGRDHALRWAAILAPLAMGGVMVGLGRDPRYALFMLLSPVMAIATWWSDRRRSRRHRRTAGARWAAALDDLRTDLERARLAQVGRLTALHPDLGEVVRRATEPSTRVWERRPGHGDAFRVRLGSADRDHDPPLRHARRPDPDDAPTVPPPGEAEVATLVAAHRHLPASPVALDLARTPVVGLVGDRATALGLARALLVQVATLHGPADLPVAILTVDRHQADWDWAKWLPHTAVDDHRLVAANRPTAERIARGLAERHVADPTTRDRAGPITGIVVDHVSLVAGPTAPVRDLLRPAHGTTMALVLAEHVDLLPASCSVVVDCEPDATAVVTEPATGTTSPVLLATLDEPTARRSARALAHLADPEQASGQASLPAMVRLVDLLATTADRPHDDPTAGGTRLATPLGRRAGGACWVDLVADGPHALVGGTTGSGKSELLRSLVAGLATRHTPDQVVFVLVDYKGGAAFRDCADLPHTVGMVTDLDDHLGARALTSLEAELRHREQVLGVAGATDLPTYVAAGAPGGPLPRLVVAVDEFATLAAELPGFLDALVGIAQRGRSLGIHLVLATQRPRGSVDANVRANTNLRIALRVQDAADSIDIVDERVAAELPRRLPGRAWVRRGHQDLELVQTALASARRHGEQAPIVVAPFRFAPTSPLPEPGPGATDDTDLVHLVEAAGARHAASGASDPRRPWLPMLPGEVSLGALLDGDPDLDLDDTASSGGHDPGRDPTTGPHRRVRDGGIAVPFGLVDLPTQQARRVVRWRPDRATLAAIGPVGSGTTTVLATLATSAALARGPDDLHLYVVDAGGGGLVHLGDLPHTGAVLGIDRTDDHAQLVSWLAREVRRRQALDDVGRQVLPRLLLLVDNLAGFLAVHDDGGSREVLDHLATVLEEGPSMRVATAVATERLAGVASGLRAGLGQRLVLGRPDDRDLALLGLRAADLPVATPGRAVDVDDGTVVQVARLVDPAGLVDRVVARHGASPTRPPRPIRGLPDVVDVADLPPPTGLRPVVVPIGVGRTGEPEVLTIHGGDHVTVAGPAGSGRTTVLQLLSSQLRRALPDAVQVALCDAGRSALHGWPSLDAAGSAKGLTHVLATGASRDDPWFVFVDDLRWSGCDDLLADLVTARADLHLVVAGRPDEVRGGFGDWRRTLRIGRTGILLQPDLAVDGDLLGARLPRRLRVPLGPGRGFVVTGGTPALAQFADVPTHPAPGSIGT